MKVKDIISFAKFNTGAGATSFMKVTTEEILGNAGSLYIERTIRNTVENSQSTNKYIIGQQLSDVLNKLSNIFIRGWSVDVAKMHGHNDDNIYLVGLDPYGNIILLFIEIADPNKGDFIIKTSYNIGIKCSTKDEFLKRLQEELEHYDGDITITIEG